MWVLSNWNLKMLVFQEGEKQRPEKKPLEKGREPTANLLSAICRLQNADYRPREYIVLPLPLLKATV